MKTVIPLFLAAGVLFVAGCQKNSSSSENMEATNSAPSELNTNAAAGGMVNTNAAPLNATNQPMNKTP